MNAISTAHGTREAWLADLALRMESRVFADMAGVSLPPYRVTCGFPSEGGLRAKNRVIGQCWYAQSSGDGTNEIVVSITQDDPQEVAAILAHEMVHAVAGAKAGHGPAFRKIAVAIGLKGPMAATVAGPRFLDAITPILDNMGPYPHAALDAEQPKKQGTRMLKASCGACGYTVRTTAKWIGVARPTCPNPNCDNHGGLMDLR